MKLLHIIPRLDHGGAERGVFDMACYANEHGHQSFVTSAGGYFETKLKTHNIPHLEYPWHSKNILTWKEKSNILIELIKSYDFDLVHAHSRVPCWIASIAKRTHNFPLITTCYAAHSMGFAHIKYPYNISFTKGDAVIATSQTIKNYIATYYPKVMDKVHLIYRGSNENPQPAKNNDIQSFKDKYLFGKAPVLIFPARITHGKGQHLLIDSLKYIESNLSLQILFMGKCDQPKYLNALLESIKLIPSNITATYIGNCDNLCAAYLCSDYVINSSTRIEPFGRIPIEAGLLKRCTIAPMEGGFTETIIPDKTGWLFKPNCAKSLGSCLNKILKMKKSELEKMQNECFEHVLNKFTLSRMGNETLALYENVLNKFKLATV